LTILNLVNKLARKIVWNKNHIIKILKIIILFTILIIFLFGLFIPSISLLEFFIFISSIFLFLSLFYYIFIAKDDEYVLIRSMWKTYFSIISLMIIMIFSVESYVNNIIFNSYKEKIAYQLEINSPEVNATFSEYNQIVDKYVSGYEKKKIDYKKILIPEKKEKEEYTVFYMNVAHMLMIITTLYMFLWMLNELKYFKVSSIKLSNYYAKK